MSYKIFKRHLGIFIPFLLSLLCILGFLLIMSFVLLYRIERQFNPIAYTLQHAIRVKGYELKNQPELINKLVAVTGHIYTDDTINQPVHLASEKFVILEQKEQIFNRKRKQGTKWRLKNHHTELCNSATMDGYNIPLSDISFLNMAFDVKPHIYIPATVKSSLQNPVIGDRLYTFRGIRSSSQINVLGTFSQNSFVPFRLKLMHNGKRIEHTFFYVSMGTFEDLIKELSQEYENRKKDQLFVAGCCLYLFLAFPYWLLFRIVWPASPEPQYNPNDKYYFRRRRGLSFRSLVFFITLGIIITLILPICLELVKLF